MSLAPVLAQSNPRETVTQSPPLGIPSYSRIQASGQSLTSESESSPPFGLSKSHISPQYVLTAAAGGRLVSLTTTGHPSPQPVSSKRGIVKGFSRKSRLRMLRLLASVNRDAPGPSLPLFVTLTYPAAFPSPRESKRHLDAFGKRLRRKYGPAAAVWRLELQARGAPHFHLLVFNVKFIPYRWVAQAWSEIVKSGDQAHQDAGTEVRRARSWKEASAYVSKYMGKEQEEIVNEETGEILNEQLGRTWGIIGRENMPIDLQSEILDEMDWYQARRILMKYLRKQGRKAVARRRNQGRHVFTRYDSERLMRQLRESLK